MLNFNNKFSTNRRTRIIILSSIVTVMAISCAFWATANCINSNNENQNTAINVCDTLTSTETQKETVTDEKSSNQPEKNSPNAESNCPAKSNKDETIKSQQINEDYTKLYPHLYCTRPESQIIPEKTIFLTFDDGPSERTSEILEILREKGIKATFFVTGNTSSAGRALMKQIVDEGHAIGIHTYTHEFRQIYSSVNAFLDDFNKIYSLIHDATGIKPTIFRFPGGSKNSFNKNNYKELTTEMTRRGFDYFDWNLSVGDAVSRTPTPTQKCINNVLNFSKNCNHGVVLMHDAKPKVTTVEALPHIIDGLKSQGFTFDKLSNNIDPAPYSLVKPYK